MRSILSPRCVDASSRIRKGSTSNRDGRRLAAMNSILGRTLRADTSDGSERIAVDSKIVAGLLPRLTSHEPPTRRDLLLQALMHLPRLAAADCTVAVSSARYEIERVWRWRASELEPL